jgi:hypothetical protein
MNTRANDASTAPAQVPSSAVTDNIGRGALTGLIPLGLLIFMITVTVCFTALARLLLEGSGFFAQQQAALIVLIGGLILTCAGYVVALWRALHRVKMWQLEGKRKQARVVLWELGATVLIVVIPVLLALLLPQHPAP